MQLFGTKGLKFLHCPGTKGQLDKLKILPWDGRGRDRPGRAGTACQNLGWDRETGQSLLFCQNTGQDAGRDGTITIYSIISCFRTSFPVLERPFPVLEWPILI